MYRMYFHMEPHRDSERQKRPLLSVKANELYISV
jgi:hypothetical protein